MRYLDLLTGPDLSFSIFYLLPILLVTWKLGWSIGILFSLISALSWLSADLTEHAYRLEAAPYWNATVRLGFFLITSYLLASLRQSLATQTALARTDPLTRLTNRLAFIELAEHELRRARRHPQPITIAYVGADHAAAWRRGYLVEHWRRNLSPTPPISGRAASGR
jgi:hypothetical protein